MEWFPVFPRRVSLTLSGAAQSTQNFNKTIADFGLSPTGTIRGIYMMSSLIDIGAGDGQFIIGPTANDADIELGMGSAMPGDHNVFAYANLVRCTHASGKFTYQLAPAQPDPDNWLNASVWCMGYVK